MTQSEVVQLLWSMSKAHGSQKALAESLGISCQYLNDVLRCRRDVSDEVATKLGLRKIVTFEPSEAQGRCE